VGVDGKSSHTKFTDVFDNASNDASFIWSSNLLLDNLVFLRKKLSNIAIVIIINAKWL
jgi:hypothetical protein